MNHTSTVKHNSVKFGNLTKDCLKRCRLQVCWHQKETHYHPLETQLFKGKLEYVHPEESSFSLHIITVSLGTKYYINH